MTKKQKIILVIIIATIAILVILLIPLIKQKALEDKRYNSISEVPNNQAAVSIFKCKYIKEEQSTSSGYNKDIYIEFGEPLYKGEESNEIYYSQLTQLVAQVNRYSSFRLIDEKNSIFVAVLCSNNQIQQTIINGDSNYYGRQESYKELKQYTKPKISEMDIQSTEISKLMENNWDIKCLNLGDSYELEDNYELYVNEGLKINSIKNIVFNIVFTDTHKDNIVNNLGTQSSLEEVVRTLGEPTFGSVEEQTIGYRNNDIYVFFTEDEVSIYRVEKVEDNNLEETIKVYLEEKNLKVFISDLTDVWEDYNNYYYDANTVDLWYTLKGVKAQYGVIGNHGLTFYTNYTGTILEGKTIEELSKEDIEIPKEIYFKNTDSVAEYELARAEKHRLILYSDDEDSEEYF